MADTLVMPDEGKLLVATRWQGTGPNGTDNQKLRLFKNDVAPVAGSVLADFVNSTFTGGGEKTIAYGSNGNPAIVAGKAQLEIGGALQTFTCTANPHTVFGWVLYDVNSGKVLYVCDYEFPVALSVGTVHTVDINVAVGMC